MLRIRLQRTGKRNQATFRVVVAEHSKPAKGKFVEILGHHNPRSKETVIKKDRVDHWISKGAKPSPRVEALIKKS